jgi:hypothetical protein
LSNVTFGVVGSDISPGVPVMPGVSTRASRGLAVGRIIVRPLVLSEFVLNELYDLDPVPKEKIKFKSSSFFCFFKDLIRSYYPPDEFIR